VKFKSGDTVVCVEPDEYQKLKRDGLYLVINANSFFLQVFSLDEMRKLSNGPVWDHERFELFKN